MSQNIALQQTAFACHCFRLGWDELINYMNDRSISSLKDLQAQTCAGTACQGCVKDLQGLFPRRNPLVVLFGEG